MKMTVGLKFGFLTLLLGALTSQSALALDPAREEGMALKGAKQEYALRFRERLELPGVRDTMFADLTKVDALSEKFLEEHFGLRTPEARAEFRKEAERVKSGWKDMPEEKKAEFCEKHGFSFFRAIQSGELQVTRDASVVKIAPDQAKRDLWKVENRDVLAEWRGGAAQAKDWRDLFGAAKDMGGKGNTYRASNWRELSKALEAKAREVEKTAHPYDVGLHGALKATMETMSALTGSPKENSTSLRGPNGPVKDVRNLSPEEAKMATEIAALLVKSRPSVEDYARLDGFLRMKNPEAREAALRNFLESVRVHREKLVAEAAIKAGIGREELAKMTDEEKTKLIEKLDEKDFKSIAEDASVKTVAELEKKWNSEKDPSKSALIKWLMCNCGVENMKGKGCPSGAKKPEGVTRSNPRGGRDEGVAKKHDEPKLPTGRQRDTTL